MQRIRIERDLLGARELPEEAYYGIHALRGSENFPILSVPVSGTLIKALALVKKAAALANRDAGCLAPHLAEGIAGAADEMIAGKLHDQIIVTPIQGGAGTSLNMNANEVIANRALELIGESKGNYKVLSPLDHVNMGQSTNDSLPTAVHIAVVWELQQLIDETANLQQAFKECAMRFDHILKMGRTHLQDAVPIRLGQEFNAYAQVLGRDIKRISAEQENMLAVNMGATAVGTGLNANTAYLEHVLEYLRTLTALDIRRVENLVDGTQSTDCYTGVSAVLKICMLNMSKIANDIRMMASGPYCGFGELKLPPRQSGSSIMPGKVNPVIAEAINQVAFQVAGNDLTISLVSEAGQFELNVMVPVLIHNLLESIVIMRNVFRVFRTNLLEGLVANEEKMSEDIARCVAVITAFAPYLGYEAASTIAKQAMASGRPVREVLLESGLMSAAEIDIILDPYEMSNLGVAGFAAIQKLRKG